MHSSWYSFSGNSDIEINIGTGTKGKYSASKSWDRVGDSSSGTWVVTKLESFSRTFTHNDDGTLAPIPIYGYFKATAGGYGPGVCEASGTLTVPTIPRASALGTMPKIVPGSSAKIPFVSPSSTFTHIVAVKFGDVTVNKTAAAGANSVTLSAEETAQFYASSPKSNTKTGSVTLTNSVGLTDAAEIKLAINAALAAPVWEGAFSFADLVCAEITGDDQMIVQGVSNVQITIPVGSAVAQHSATLKRYIATCGSVTGSAEYSDTGDVTILLAGCADGIITVSAVDSRGNQTAVTKSAEVIPYTQPLIRRAVAKRVNGVSQVVELSVSGSFYADMLGVTENTIESLTYTYTEADGVESEPMNLVFTVSGSTVSFAGTIQGDLGAAGFTALKSFNIRVEVTDKLRSYSLDIALDSGAVVMDMYRNGDVYGVSCGGLYDPNIGGPLQIEGKSWLDTVYPIGSIYIAYHHIDPTTMFGGTWERISGQFLLAAAESDTIGETGGESEHKLTAAELPKHRHSISDAGAHTHEIGYDTDTAGGGGYASVHKAGSSGADGTAPTSESGEHDHGGYTGYIGSSTAHNNMPPYIKVSIWRRVA